MPRQARLDAPGTLHHVMIRGIEGQQIFWDIQDRKDFVTRLGDLSKQTGTRILAFSGEPCSWILSREYGIAMADIARTLGVCASAIN
jgi:hypothetical protein